MGLPVWRIEGPDVAVAQNITPNGREPGPPLETAHRLGSIGIPTVPVRSFLIIRPFEKEHRFSRSVRVSAASFTIGITTVSINTVQCHLTSKGGLIGSEPLR